MKKKNIVLFLTPLLVLISSSVFLVASCSNQSNTTNSGTIISPSKPIDPNKPSTPIPPSPTPPTNPNPTPPVTPPPSKPDPIPPVTPPPSKPEPNPPSKPNPSIDVDNIKRTINVPYLQNVIKTNDFGYNADSFQKTILKYKTNKNTTFLNKIFTDKSISNWESIKDLNVIKDDEKGTASLSFGYGGTHSYNVDLNSKDGLLPDSYYYEKMNDLSFAFRISYSSIVSGRNFPIFNNYGQCVKYQDGLAEAGYRDNALTGVTTKGTFLDGEGRFVKDYYTTASAWIVDYLPSLDSNTQDFYEFIVATNIHVSNLSGAFYFYDPSNGSGFAQDKHTGVPLDPIYITTSWAKPNGKLDYNNPNSFTNDNYVNNFSTFKNLSFQDDIYSHHESYGNEMTNNDYFISKVIKDLNRQNIPDNKAFSSWDHPLEDKYKKQKENILTDYNFYNPEYSLEYSIPGAQNYWKNQLNNKNNSVTYTNNQPDLNFVKVQFSKSDLQAKWPKLLKAIESNKMDTYLLPLKTDLVNPLDDVFYYYAGNPMYGFPPNTDIGTQEKANGYKYGIDKIGTYYRSGKIAPHIYKEDGVERKFDVWPNNIDDELVDGYTAMTLSHYNSISISGESPYQNEYIYLADKKTSYLRKWSAYNNDLLNQTFRKILAVNSNSTYLESYLTRDDSSLKSFNPEYFASSSSRGMVKKTLNSTKKYWWGTSEYTTGGNSGSIVITPKLQIGGILSSKKSGGEENTSKQAIFESFVNNGTNIISGEKVISNGIKQKLIDLKINSIIYNKKE